MYIDLIAPDSYIQVNRNLATLFGLNTAVYAAELCSVLVKVKKKKVYDENGYFNLNRRYIKDRTTLSSTDQKLCDEILVRAGVMLVDAENPDKICINPEKLAGIIAGTSIQEAKSLAKNVNAEVKQAAKEKRAEQAELKKSNIILALKKYITEKKPVLVEKMGNWIETCIKAKKRQITKDIVIAFETAISVYNDIDREKIIDHAIVYQYSDATWSINMLIRQGKLKQIITNTPSVQKVNTGIDENNVF